ncbi:MAG: tandem-95 repeat protein [Planctomycetaceae bacterium]|nr:tandem-95 repeat protein [Planctomycetaceae bacterium]
MRSSRRRLKVPFCFESVEPRLLLAGDLVAHWRADDLVDRHADGESVAEWTDRVDGVAAVGLGAPVVIHDGMGGRASIRFDSTGSQDGFRVSSTDSPLSNANDFSLVVMFASDQRSTNLAESWYQGAGLVHANSLGFSQDWGISLMSTGQVATGLGAGLGQPSTSLLSASNSLNDGGFHVVIVSRQADQLTLMVDDGAAVVADGASAAARDVTAFDIGQNLSRSEQFRGEIAEIQIYDGALTVAEAAEVYAEITDFYQNSPPLALDDDYEMLEDSFLFVGGDSGVLANDSDADGDALTTRVDRLPLHGTLGLNADGSFLYDPDADFFGVDTFAYRAVDFRGSEPATVRVKVNSVHDLPKGVADEYKAIPSTVLKVSSMDGVLANDFSVDDLPLRAALVDEPSFGQLVLNSDGSLTFDPLGEVGTATFGYQVEDGVGASNPIAVSIVVNSSPLAVPDLIRLEEDQVLSLTSLQGLLVNDVDEDGDSLQAILVAAPQHVDLALAADGSLIVIPPKNFFGEDQFSYQVTDGVDASLPVAVQVQVLPVNDPPSAVNDLYFADGTGALDVMSDRGVLVNDADIERQALSASMVRPPTNGRISLATDGSFVYRAEPGFQGRDTFEYQVRDAGGELSTAKVVLFVGESPLLISEILAANGNSLVTRVRPTSDSSFSRRDPESPDWLEIQNLTNQPVDLSGYYLSDNPDQPTKWTFPVGTIVDANGFLVVLASGLDIPDPLLDELGMLHVNFKLDASGDYLSLASPDRIVIDEVAPRYPIQTADVSFGRVDGEWKYLMSPTPGKPTAGLSWEAIVQSPQASVASGYFDAGFEVRLETKTVGSSIRYTLDGSTPTLTNGLEYQEAIQVGTTTTLRARAFRADQVPSESVTYSYLFLDDVLSQTAEPTGFPLRWGIAGLSDYAMDPRVATDDTSDYYDPDVRAALQSHPSISIVTDLDHLFDRSTGIYANPQRAGVAWERPASMEFITSDGNAQIQVNAGLRVQGGASRNPNRPKHNLRLLFKERYGPGKLEFPLFGNETVDRFDTIILRGGNGDSWFHPRATQQQQAQYIRDQWHRDTQQAMGRLTVAQRYVHLYINGLYWGLYHIFEKPNAAYFAEHFGGSPQDYDVVQHQGGTVDGDREIWNEMFDIARDGLESEAAYQQIQQYVDLPSLVDYLLINFYSGNVDWDNNNWFGGRKREDGAQWQFFTWDAERTFLSPADSRVSISNRLQPTELHQRLLKNSDYRMLFADHVQRHFFNGGLLTPESAEARWMARADEIALPLVAESARWGDAKRASRPYRPQVEWQNELDRLRETYFPHRTETVLKQLQRRDVFPEIAAPGFNQFGGEIEAGFELQLNSTEGVVYFTTDGKDPRQSGGGLNPTALRYETPVVLVGDTRIKARTWLDGVWSALSDALFLTPTVPASAGSLRISEIHYNPAAPTAIEREAGFTDNDEFEFIELVNIGSSAIDLSRVTLERLNDQGVAFEFVGSDIERLAVGEHVVVVENLGAFSTRYRDSSRVAGQWSGRLGNGGELVTLAVDEQVIQSFAYDDLWLPATDGGGVSLEIANPTQLDLAAWSSALSWQSSRYSGGTPGRSPDSAVIGDSNGDGVFDSEDISLVVAAREYEDSENGNSTFAEGDWNGDGEFDSRDIVFAFQQGGFIDSLLAAEQENAISALLA